MCAVLPVVCHPNRSTLPCKSRGNWQTGKLEVEAYKISIACTLPGLTSTFVFRLVQISFIFGILGIWLIMSLVRLPYRVCKLC